MYFSLKSCVLCLCVWACVGHQVSNTTQAPAQSGDVTLGYKAYLTSFSCIALLVVLSMELVSCSVAMFATTLFLRVCGVIDSEDGLKGLMNSSVITVQLLVVLIAPISRLPLAKKLIRLVLSPRGEASSNEGLVRSPSMAMTSLRVAILAYSLSWFVGNIPVTAMFTPLIHQYCLEHELPSSQLLMNLHMATLIGGTFSKIGVSTTLLINGMMETEGIPAMGFFELLKVSGVPALVGLAYFAFAPRFLLPRTTSGLVSHVKEQAKYFIADFSLLATSPLIGKRVADIGEEFFSEEISIVQVISADGSLHAPPDDSLVLAAKDVVGFTGPLATLQECSKWLHMEWLPVGAPATSANNGSGVTVGADSPLGDSRGTPFSNASILGQSFARMSVAKHRQSLLRKSAASPGGVQTRISLAVAEEGDEPIDSRDTVFAEIVLSHEATCIGQSAQSIRRNYRAALIAMRRRGVNITPAEVSCQRMTFQAGDTLLLLGPSSVFKRFHPRDFIVATIVDETSDNKADEEAPRFVPVPSWFWFGRFIMTGAIPVAHLGSPEVKSSPLPANSSAEQLPLIGGRLSPMAKQRPATLESQNFIKVVQVPRWYPYLSLVVFATAIGCSIGGIALELCCQCAVIALLLLRLRRPEDAFKSLKLEVFIVMAFSFGLGAAMSKSGLSEYLADKLGSSGLSGWPLLLTISFTAAILGNIISSKAAVQVLFPVVIDIARKMGSDPSPIIAVLAASVVTSLATPFAHATALVVMGPGGYTSKDFIKFGIPLNILMCVLFATSAHIAYDS